MSEDHCTSPVRTSKPPEAVTLTGAAIPFYRGLPVLVMVVGSPLHHVPLFSTREKASFLEETGVPFDDTKMVSNGPEFLANLPEDLVVILDPWITPEGKVRYTQIQR